MVLDLTDDEAHASDAPFVGRGEHGGAGTIGGWVVQSIEPLAVGRRGQVVGRPGAQTTLARAVAESMAQALSLATGARMADLEERIQRLEQAQRCQVSVSEFPGYRLRAPLTVILEQEEDGTVLASVPELDLWADGFSRADALEDLKGLMSSLARNLLETSNVRLGPRPQRWKALLARLAEPI